MVVKNILWDWNGTLLDDVNLCVKAINIMQSARGIAITDKQRYKDIFTFPVKDYYEKAGFDLSKEGFEKPAMEFINLYRSHFNDANIFDGVDEVLNTFYSKGMRQFVLSAMEQGSLVEAIKHFGIDKYFEDIVGIDNHFAQSKIDRGVELMKRHQLNPLETLLIGDTLHDKETADILGVKCLLISNGHQSHNRLYVEDNVVIKNIKEVLSVVGSEFPYQ